MPTRYRGHVVFGVFSWWNPLHTDQGNHSSSFDVFWHLRQLNHPSSVHEETAVFQALLQDPLEHTDLTPSVFWSDMSVLEQASVDSAAFVLPGKLQRSMASFRLKQPRKQPCNPAPRRAVQLIQFEQDSFALQVLVWTCFSSKCYRPLPRSLTYAVKACATR